ncbi:MAG: hypothetical protein ABSG77_06900 [Candidatus Acidiferrum sp.]
MEQKVRHENLVFMRVRVERDGQVGHVEILPRHVNLFAELVLGEPQHVLRQLVGCVPLLPPKTVGSRLLCQTAALVFLPAPARTRVIPADFLADVKTHNVATLPRGIGEDKSRRRESHILVGVTVQSGLDSVEELVQGARP